VNAVVHQRLAGDVLEASSTRPCCGERVLVSAHMQFKPGKLGIQAKGKARPGGRTGRRAGTRPPGPRLETGQGGPESITGNEQRGRREWPPESSRRVRSA
jgi:hypothetical protein